MKKWISILVLGILCWGCEDVIDVDLNTAAPRLVIDARLELLEDASSQNTVLLTRSSGFFEEDNPLVTDAQVQVMDGNGVTYPFVYDPANGLYRNANLQIQDDLDYTLTIVDQGQTYEATQQLVRTVPLIDIEQQEIEGFGEVTEITAFYEDPETPGDNYLFVYEDPNNFEVDLREDEFSNGNRSPQSFFIEELEPNTPITLKIAGIDAQAFRFFETLLQQTDAGGGGPFDTQPATVRGNIVNQENREQFPFGYFRVSQVYQINYLSQ
ncbi:DUF4249 domain-containing protein [Nonlabens marinus]|uniref:DUF4249 domain-containing protein n=1 Tax=Nonlabens marinus S1-08 TaxID=1454201 RepID=W8VNU8_9FLAO|nr:DUF4249 domain-containing protein [Nonlabens marinus]BAO54085.1 hypothetical protein NMS_0076 [Nonlabens marinus S1-08]